MGKVKLFKPARQRNEFSRGILQFKETRKKRNLGGGRGGGGEGVDVTPECHKIESCLSRLGYDIKYLRQGSKTVIKRTYVLCE